MAACIFSYTTGGFSKTMGENRRFSLVVLAVTEVTEKLV
jgi:hypothetical protein